MAPNAIYSYYPSRNALIDALLDDTLAAVPMPRLDVEPVDGLRGIMLDTYDVLLQQAHLVALYVARSGSRGDNAWRLGHRMLELLERAQVPAEAARIALQVLIVQTIGFASFATAASASGATRSKSRQARRAEFEQALAWLLAGIGVAASD